eukprot:GHVN01106506.1.p1 GENE.GHVN01106506.1~~GHVN01106506.1.p1  ORF type:complete len:555 (-),score=78.61 GHVN01106506.1:1184-2698(-)
MNPQWRSVLQESVLRRGSVKDNSSKSHKSMYQNGPYRVESNTQEAPPGETPFSKHMAWWNDADTDHNQIEGVAGGPQDVCIPQYYCFVDPLWQVQIIFKRKPKRTLTDPCAVLRSTMGQFFRYTHSLARSTQRSIYYLFVKSKMSALDTTPLYRRDPPHSEDDESDVTWAFSSGAPSIEQFKSHETIKSNQDRDKRDTPQQPAQGGADECGGGVFTRADVPPPESTASVVPRPATPTTSLLTRLTEKLLFGISQSSNEVAVSSLLTSRGDLCGVFDAAESLTSDSYKRGLRHRESSCTGHMRERDLWLKLFESSDRSRGKRGNGPTPNQMFCSCALSLVQTESGDISPNISSKTKRELLSNHAGLKTYRSEIGADGFPFGRKWLSKAAPEIGRRGEPSPSSRFPLFGRKGSPKTNSPAVSADGRPSRQQPMILLTFGDFITCYAGQTVFHFDEDTSPRGLSQGFSHNWRPNHWPKEGEEVLHYVRIPPEFHLLGGGSSVLCVSK